MERVTDEQVVINRKLANEHIDFDSTIFSVMRNKAESLDWLIFETRIRQIV